MVLRLELENFSYPGQPSLFCSMSLKLEAGKAVGLVGGSGSGKSSLITLLAGLHPDPLGGCFLGRITGGETMGYLSADPGLFLTGFCRTVMEEVGWSLFGQGQSLTEVVARVELTLRELGLSSLAWKNPHKLSGGQQQQVALASVWARNPRVLLLDEPVSRLDSWAKDHLVQAVRQLCRTQGVAVVWATSKPEEVSWCDECWTIADHRLEHGKNAAGAGEGREDGSWIDRTQSALPRRVQISRGGFAAPKKVSDGVYDESLRLGIKLDPLVDGATAFLSSLTSGTEGVVADSCLKRNERSGNEKSSDAAIEVNGVSYRLPGEEEDFFSELSWRVEPGECVGLVGRNGAGKTTLARMIRGLDEPYSGDIFVWGKKVSRRDVASLTSLVAYTCQDPNHLFLCSRVDEEFLYSGELLGLEQELALKRIDEALALFELKVWADAHPRELPATPQSLLALALSWYTMAEVQILDEPRARLDGRGRRIINSVLADWRRRGTTVVVIDHELSWIQEVCTQTVVLST